MVRVRVNKYDALRYHSYNKAGKLGLLTTKPLATQKDLSLAYSPGVAYPCLEIHKSPEEAYKYTTKGNYVAVISNGTAVLGLGNLGALASKPVMEGKAGLFKRFADIDAIDLEVQTENIDEFVNAIKYLGPSWGGINLEDIKSPECFVIEEKLQAAMDIPVFHDDQHGTAIIVGAALLNALDITRRNIKEVRIVVNGVGAAGTACIDLMKKLGVPHDNIVPCDEKGVISVGRDLTTNQWKQKHAITTELRTLAQAMEGADMFLGLSVGNVLTKEMLLSMNNNPIIFAMANPEPEVHPEFAKKIRPDCIIATGRSDYSNQINNVMGFPYIFRGALDVHAKVINDDMKLAASYALAKLARQPVVDEVEAIYANNRLQYGSEYLIPTPFDPRLIYTIPPAVAQAAIESKVACIEVYNEQKYTQSLRARLSPVSNFLNLLSQKVQNNPQKIIFAEGEEEAVIKAAMQWHELGYGQAILVGRERKILQTMENLGLNNDAGIEIANAAISPHNDKYIEYMYKRLQRRGYLHRSCVHAVKTDRNIFAACMLACGDGDALVTGLTREYHTALCEVQRIIDAREVVFGLSVAISEKNTIFIADTAIHIEPSAEELAEIAIQSAQKVQEIGYEARVALISFSTFGSDENYKSCRIKRAVELLKERKATFAYDGEMSIEVALNSDMRKLYPFSRLDEKANVLIMPGLHSAHISTGLLHEMGDNTTIIGPILNGMTKPIQILDMHLNSSEVLNMALLAAVDAIEKCV